MTITYGQLKRFLDESVDNDVTRMDKISEASKGNRKARWNRKQWKKREQKMRTAGQKGRIAIPGIRNQSTTSPSKANDTHRRPPPVDPNAKQKLTELINSISKDGAKSQEDFLRELSKACGKKMGNLEFSKYFSNRNTGDELILRLANHRGNASSFKRWDEKKGNFGIVIKLKKQLFVPDDEVEYKEEVFFWDDLDAETQIKIAAGLGDWVETGQYTGPQGNQTFVSPGNGRPSRTRTPKSQQGMQAQPSDAPQVFIFPPLFVTIIVCLKRTRKVGKLGTDAFPWPDLSSMQALNLSTSAVISESAGEKRSVPPSRTISKFPLLLKR